MTRELRNAMSHFTTGVTVVTARFDEQDWGMTCNSFSTVSLEPALVLWSIRKESLSHQAYIGSGGYMVSILARTQQHLAMQFTQGTQAERFRNVPVEHSASSLRPRIKGAVAWFDCALEAAVPAGDHDILIGRVLDFGIHGGDSLVYTNRTFGSFKPL
ncbi:MAG: flavin reductase family protein [Burkholderiaceae bacterium]|nr:flavin reductase family protein [Burkholderiaceae bacterium]